YVTSSGSFANNDVVKLQFARTGDRGQTGLLGASISYGASVTMDSSSGAVNTLTQACANGKVPTGGGGQVVYNQANQQGKAILLATFPSDNTGNEVGSGGQWTSWTVVFQNSSNISGGAALHVYVICAYE
ncbi:MAG: hypothetical protein ABR562_04260, partial [Thermoplasmatota archaeon]